MFYKITLLCSIFLTLPSCFKDKKLEEHKKPTTKVMKDDYERVASKNKEEEEQKKPIDETPPELSFKDTSAPLSPLTQMPSGFAIKGWKKIALVDKPKNIPENKPENTTEYYRAEKTIDGKKRTISVAFGDLLKESDTIVNAANSFIEGGGGIDGAIHDKAKLDGQDLMKDEAIAYKRHHGISSIPTGSAMVTKSYGLAPNISMVVFAVGPSTGKPTKNDELLLYSAIYNSLIKASEYKAKSISFPAVSTGIFGFPLEKAAPLYFKAALEFFKEHPETSIENIRFINFDNYKDKPTVQRIAESFVKIF